MLGVSTVLAKPSNDSAIESSPPSTRAATATTKQQKWRRATISSPNESIIPSPANSPQQMVPYNSLYTQTLNVTKRLVKHGSMHFSNAVSAILQKNKSSKEETRMKRLSKRVSQMIIPGNHFQNWMKNQTVGSELESNENVDNAGHLTLNHAIANAGSPEQSILQFMKLYEQFVDNFQNKAPTHPPNSEVFTPLQPYNLIAPTEIRSVLIVEPPCDVRSNQLDHAPVSELMEYLLDPRVADPHFQETFFLCYRLFLSPSELLAKIISRIELECQIQSSTRNLTRGERIRCVRYARAFRRTAIESLVYWVNAHWEDFSQCGLIEPMTALAHRLKCRVDDADAYTYVRESQKILETIRQQKWKVASHRLTDFLHNGETMPAKLYTGTQPIILVWSLEKLAHQLAHQSATKMAVCCAPVHYDTWIAWLKHPIDLNNANHCDSWSTFRAMLACKSFMDYSKMFRERVYWVVNTILEERQHLNKAMKCTKSFIKLASLCLSMNDFDSCGTLLAGLRHSLIWMDTELWTAMKQKHCDTLKELVELFHDYSAYRKRLVSSKGPCLPFLAMTLFHIQRYSSDLVQCDSVIPFHACRAIALCIHDWRQVAAHEYLKSMTQSRETGELGELETYFAACQFIMNDTQLRNKK